MLVNESFSIEQEVTTQKEANEAIATLVRQASNLIEAAQCVADNFGLDFNSPIGDYGMGGVYIGTGTEEFPQNGWEASDVGKWISSSANC